MGRTLDKQIRLGWVLILTFLIPLTIYSKTLLPGLEFWDTGEFQTIAYTFDIGHPTGYPTYILLGKIFVSIIKFGSIAWRMNFFSALSVSLGVFIFSLLIRKITHNYSLAILGSIFLSVNPYLWSVAIRADPHALHFLFTSVFMYLGYLVATTNNFKYIPLLSFVTGLSLGNHMLSVFFLPPLVLLYLSVLRKKRKRNKHLKLFLSCGLLILGTSIYLLLPIISNFRDPLTVDYSIDSLQNFSRHVLGQDFQPLEYGWLKTNFKDSIIYYFTLAKNSFPLFSWVFVILGLLFLKPKRGLYDFICILVFVTTIFFSLRYQNAVIERYFLPSFLISTLWLSKFFNRLMTKRKNVFVKGVVYFYLVITIIYSLNLNYIPIDESNNTRASEWATQSLSETKPDSVIFSWWSYSTPLWYMQKIEKVRQDVTIINTGADKWEVESQKFIGNKDVYFIQKIDLINKNYTIKQTGNLYKLEKLPQ